MRANSLNLKKKIAFIASLAMIAGTAAYLPANVAQNLGFGNSIVADADDALAAIDTFKAYVKVDGKYLSTKEGKPYLASSLTETGVTSIENVAAVTADKNENYLKRSTETGYTAVADDDRYVVGTKKVTLPADLTPGASITIEIVVNNGCAFDKTSATSINVGTVNKYGMAQVAADTKAIKVNSDNGVNKESVDFSGMTFEMATPTLSSVLVGTDAGKVKNSAGTQIGSCVVAIPASNGAYSAATDKTADSAYQYVEESDVFATVLTVNGGLTTHVDPTAVIKVDLGASDNWTVRGAGVNNGVLTMSMGTDGVAKSGLIQATKSGKTEYFIVVIDNKAEATGESEVELGYANLSMSDVKLENLTATTVTPPATRAKAVKEISTTDDNGTKFLTKYTIYNNNITKNISSTNKETITLTDTTGAFDLPDAELKVYDMTDPAAPAEIAATSGTVTVTSGKAYKVVKDNGNGTVLSKSIDAATNISGATITVADPYAFDTVTFSTATVGKFTSPVLKYFAAKETLTAAGTAYVQYDFTNDYKVELVGDATEKAKADYVPVYVDVKNGNVIEKPADASKAGFTFAGWTYGANASNGSGLSTTDAFSTLIDKQQNADNAGVPNITPNMALYAKYTPNKYTATFDANGGYLDGTAFGSAYTQVAVNSDNKTTQACITLTSSDSGSSVNSDDLATFADKNDVTDASRLGYTFKGWALTADATEPVETIDYKTFRPAENNGKVTLYAVWEANESTVSFCTLGIDGATGMVGKTSDETANFATSAFGTKNNASFAKAADGVLTVKTGEAFGKLPTPVKKGYTFEGWYRVAVDAKALTFSAEPVTDTTVLDETKFDQATAPSNGVKVGDYDETKVTLYAKFTQNTYKVDFNLDGGKWADNTDEEKAIPATYKYYDTTVKFFNAKGRDIDFALQPTKGSGAFYSFTGFTLNGGSTKYLTDYSSAVEKLATAADVTFKATYEAGSTSNGYINLDLNDGQYLVVDNFDSPSVYAVPATPYATNTAQACVLKGDANGDGTADAAIANTDYLAPVISGQKNVAIGETIEDDEIIDNTYKYVVVKPGYTFTGWFADEECTTPYTFDKYPNGTEVTVYAGWKADTDTRYNVNYNLISADGSIIAASTNDNDKNDANDGVDKSKFNFTKQYYGETGSKVSAADKKIIYNGKTYVFDAKKSANQKYEGTIKASYNIDEFKNGKLEVAGIGAYKADVNKTGYTVLQATFVEEGTEPKELGTVSATSITVAEDGTVKWTAADNAVKYKVIKIGSNGKAYAGAETDKTTFKFAAVPTSDYEVQVVAFDADGNKTTSEKVKVTVKSTGTLGTVDAKTIAVGTDRKTVTWTAIEGATSYRVIKTVNGKAYASAAVTEPTYTFANVTYSAFSVKVVAMKGTEKTYSDAVNVAVAESADHGKVVNPKVTKDGKVTWTAVPDAVSYRVAKFINDKAYYGTEVKAPATEYTFAKVPTDDYKVYVVSYFADGSKTYGTITKVSTKLDAPTNVQLSADKKTVTFDAVEGAVKYQIKKTTIAGKAYYGSKFEGTSVTMGSAATKGMTIQVLAFDAEGNSSLSDGVVVE